MNRLVTLLILMLACVGHLAHAEPLPEWAARLTEKFETQQHLSVLIEIRTPEQDQPQVAPQDNATPAERTARIAARVQRTIHDVMPAARNRIVAAGIDVQHTYSYQPILLADVTRDAVDKLAANSDVVNVSENIWISQQPLNPPPPRIPITETETDDKTDLGRPHVAITVPSVKAEQAWAQGYRGQGQGQSIAIFDTGINAGHEMFAGRIVAEACFSNGTISPGYESLCPEGKRTVIGTGAASACPPPNSTSSAGVCMHGSHVAGIAGGDNRSVSNRLRGVAPEAGLIPIQVFTRLIGCAGCLGAYSSDLLAAMDWVIANAATYSIASVNMSLGGRSYSGDCFGYGLERSIQTARELGVVVAIASGNDGYVGYIAYPGCVKDAFSVGSISTAVPRPSYFTNTASTLDIYAPGEDVNSAVHGGRAVYARYSGTSMATPHVAGAAAILKSKMPTATAAQVEYALRISGPMVSGAGWIWTNPRLDVAAALEVLGQDPPMAGIPLPGLFPGDHPSLRSMVRVLNPEYGSTSGSITLVQEQPRMVLGTYRFTIPEHGAVQFSVRDVENAIRAQAAPQSPVTAIVGTARPGFAQHIVTDTSGQLLSNLSVCGATMPASPALSINHVHTARIADASSHIVIMNNSGVGRAASFALYNAINGAYLGVAKTAPISANTSVRVSAVDLFAKVDHGMYQPPGIPASVTYVNMFLNADFTGVVAHAVHHASRGLIADMTAKCAT